MIKLFSQYFLKFRINHELKKNKFLRTTIPYQQSRSMGILFTANDTPNQHAVAQLIQNLEKDGKVVKTLTFVPDDRPTINIPYSYFSKKDISFLGEINSPNVEQFIKTPFDFLYCTDNSLSFNMFYILTQCKARCRVGVYDKDNGPFLELMIQSQGTPLDFIESMCSYTKQIR